MNDVPDVDLPDAGHAVDRRGQSRVAEVDAGGLDDRLVGLHHRLQLRELRLLGIDQLRRREPFALEGGVPVEIGLGVLHLRLIAVAVRYRLVELRLVRPRIYLGKKVALLYGMALREGDVDELAADLAAYNHIVVGDDGAHATQIDRHVAVLDLLRDHRDRWRRSRRFGGLRRAYEEIADKNAADRDCRHRAEYHH